MSAQPETEGYYWIKLEHMLRDGRSAEAWTVACMGVDGWWRVTGDGHPVTPEAVTALGPKIEPPED